MTKKLDDLLARIETWKSDMDALHRETDGDTEITDEQDRRFNELREEADAIDADLARTQDAESVRAAFSFLTRNVFNGGLSPNLVTLRSATVVAMANAAGI